MVASWKTTFQKVASTGGTENAINPYFVLDALNKVLTPDDVLVIDTGYMGAYANACLEIKSPGRKYVRTAGSLGWSLPASLGAQCAVGNKGRVICLIGDGGIGYHVTEIETAVRCGLPVVVVVMNNCALAFEYHLQKIFYKDVVPQANDFLDIDYGAVAKVFGAYGEKVRRAENVAVALRRALDSGRPAVVDCAIDKEVYAPVVNYESAEARQI